MIFRYFNNKHLVYLFLLLLLLLLSLGLSAQIPSGYYKNAEGKNKAGLKTSLYNIIKDHNPLSYSGLSNSFRASDWHPATDDAPIGYFWDMYSNYHRTSWTGMNREHSLPKSWFGIASGQEDSAPIGCDLHNLYPSDAAANSEKSNYPIGDVTGIVNYTNGVVKVGASVTYPVTPKFDGTVFEPANEYKGDFARDYMYMVTCYEDYSKRWQSLGTSCMLLGGTYPVFTPTAIVLLLKWHRQDPISQKEIDRNNAVFKLQGNRNPFIDHPELAEFIWGKYMSDNWVEGADLPEDELNFQLKPYPVLDSLLTTNVYHPEHSTYVVKSISGITVMTGTFSVSGDFHVNVLKNGMYILEVYSAGKRRYISKFIIRHKS